MEDDHKFNEVNLNIDCCQENDNDFEESNLFDAMTKQLSFLNDKFKVFESMREETQINDELLIERCVDNLNFENLSGVVKFENMSKEENKLFKM
jgi:hypothetical protein